MCHGLCAGAELKHRKNLRARINGQPQPEHLCGAAQPGAQFVQLEVEDLQGVEAVLVQGLSLLPSASEPGGDGGLTVAEDALGSGSVQSFGQCREHYGNLLRGGFQTIQGGVASGSERAVAGLAAKRLDPFGLAMLTISDDGMDLSIGDPEVRALLVGTSEPRGVYAIEGSPAAFHLWPGTHRCRRWPSN
jgi:hypothetical protein